MAIVTGGFTGPFTGKIGNAVGTYVNGQNRLRGRPERNKEKDRIMTDQRMRTQLSTKILTEIKEFISFSYREVMRSHPLWNYHNAASSYVRKAIVGTFPDLRFDFSKILFAAGTLPVPEGVSIEFIDNGLKINWKATKEDKLRIMVIAYYPETNKANFIRSGVNGNAGTETLELGQCKKGMIMEVYVAFISDDLRHVSNSVYLGQFECPN